MDEGELNATRRREVAVVGDGGGGVVELLSLH
jgi:hypothetical protein